MKTTRFFLKLFSLLLVIGATLISPVISREDNKQMNSNQNKHVATFAGGCFWCMEEAFEGVPGVTEVLSGYTGGSIKNPTYEQVSAGSTGHHESVKVTFDSGIVSYEKLLDIFWHNIDPFDDKGQFCDKGSSYRAAIFYFNDAQKAAAEASKKSVTKILGQAVVTQILPGTAFYPAEENHQKYAKKNPIRYTIYRTTCGRDWRLRAVWDEK